MTPEERQEFITQVIEVVRTSTPQLSDEERQWVKLAIEAEARKIRFRDAVIEKTLTGLIWAALVGFGYMTMDFLKNHGMRF